MLRLLNQEIYHDHSVQRLFTHWQLQHLGLVKCHNYKLKDSKAVSPIISCLISRVESDAHNFDLIDGLIKLYKRSSKLIPSQGSAQEAMI